MSVQLIADANPGVASWSALAGSIKSISQHTISGPITDTDPIVVTVASAAVADFVFVGIRTTGVNDYTGYITEAYVSAVNQVTFRVRGGIQNGDAATFNVMVVGAL